GLTLPTLGSSAAASLSPARFAAGSAVSNTSRQVGTVLGVSFLVVLLGDVTGRTALAAFQRGWTMMLVLAAATSLVCVGVGRTRARGPVEPAAVRVVAADRRPPGPPARWAGVAGWPAGASA